MEAVYKFLGETKVIKVDRSKRYSTISKTGGPSQVVSDIIDSTDFVDKDVPSVGKPDSELTQLRGQLTFLQDEINTFLTAQMARAGSGGKQQLDEANERKLLDGDDEDA